MPFGREGKKPPRGTHGNVQHKNSGNPDHGGSSTCTHSRRLEDNRCMDCGAKTKRGSGRKYEIGVVPVKRIRDTPTEGGSSGCAHSHLDRHNRCLDCGTKIKRGASKNVSEPVSGTSNEGGIPSCTHSRRDTRNRCLDCDATLPPLAAWASETETVTKQPGSGTTNEDGSSWCGHSHCDPNSCILKPVTEQSDSDTDDDMMAIAGSCIPQIHQGMWGNSEFVDIDGWSVCVDSDTIDDLEVSEESADESDDVSKKKPSLTTMKIGKPFHIEMPPPDTEDDFILTFDGYYRKKGKNGGYGALLRTGNGVPISAVAGGSQHWISPYYHTLEGFLSGLDLAIAADVDSVSCICNSYRLPKALSACFINNKEGRCRSHPDATFDVVCRICLKYRLSKDEPIDLVWDILRKIVKKGEDFYHTCGFMDCSGKEWNKPADFLAKLVRDPGQERVLTPEEFPEDFWNLLVFNVPA